MQISASQMAFGVDPIPLCRTYEVVHLAVLRGVNGGPLLAAEHHVLTSVGMTQDGQLEVLGAYHVLAPKPQSTHHFASDFLARGVERVGMLIDGGSASMRADVLRAFPDASAASAFHPVAQMAISVASPRCRTAVGAGLDRIRRAQSQEHASAVLDALANSTWQGAAEVVQMCREAIPQWRAIYELSKPARARVMRGEDAAWALQQGVSRAMARHCFFESGESAAAFAAAWLVQAEGRQRRRIVTLRYREGVAAARASG